MPRNTFHCSLGLLGLTVITASVTALHADPQQTQTVRGVTISITGCGFDGGRGYARNFGIQYRVSTDSSIVLPPNKGAVNFIQNSQAYDPDGGIFANGGGGSFGSGSPDASAYFDDVFGTWPNIEWDVDFADPQNLVLASGKYDGLINFVNVPLPAGATGSLAASTQAVSPLGTKVTLTNITIDRTVNTTTMTFHAQPAPAAPDLTFGCWTNLTITTDSGNKLDCSQKGPSNQVRDFTIVAPSVPAVTDKSLTIAMFINEHSSMLTQGYLRHFHFKIPVASLSAPGLWNNHNLQEASANNVDVAWEYNEKLSPDDRYATAHFLLKDKTDPTVQWKIKSITGTNEVQAPVNGRPSPGVSVWPPDIFQQDAIWRLDGTPIADGELTQSMRLGGVFDKTQSPVLAAFPPSKTLSVIVTAEAVKRITHVVRFPNIPIPAPGQSIEVNKTITEKYGNWLEICTVREFDPEHPLPLVPGVTDNPNLPKYGIAFLIVEPPDRDHPARRFDYWPYSAVDSTQINLTDAFGFTSLQADPFQLIDTRFANARPRRRTFLVPLKSLTATSVDIRMIRYENVNLDREEDVAFSNLPAPSP